jgi:hypothetical protein
VESISKIFSETTGPIIIYNVHFTKQLNGIKKQFNFQLILVNNVPVFGHLKKITVMTAILDGVRGYWMQF